MPPSDFFFFSGDSLRCSLSFQIGHLVLPRCVTYLSSQLGIWAICVPILGLSLRLSCCQDFPWILISIMAIHKNGAFHGLSWGHWAVLLGQEALNSQLLPVPDFSSFIFPVTVYFWMLFSFSLHLHIFSPAFHRYLQRFSAVCHSSVIAGSRLLVVL